MLVVPPKLPFTQIGGHEQQLFRVSHNLPGEWQAEFSASGPFLRCEAQDLLHMLELQWNPRMPPDGLHYPPLHCNGLSQKPRTADRGIRNQPRCKIDL